MTGKSTWFWLFIAAVLLAFIVFVQRPAHRPPPGPAKILPELTPGQVTAIQIIPKGQSPIRAERTNEGWRLVSKAATYPAQSASVEGLLSVLAELVPAMHIKEKEVKNRFHLDEDFGFADPQTTLVLEQKDYQPKLRIGLKTPPGDQVYAQVVGQEGAFVVDADLLQLIPREATAWREKTLIGFKGLGFDRIAVTNGPKAFVLQEEPASHLWRISIGDVWPRAHNQKIEQALQQLERIRIQQFVGEDGKADLEALGLQPPELSLCFAQGTNPLVRLEFGKSGTNESRLVYARRIDQNVIGTVPGDLVAAWRDSVNDFRDPHLAVLTAPVDLIAARGQDSFLVQRQTNQNWQVAAEGSLPFPGDAGMVRNLLTNLADMRVVQFRKDNVTELGWAEFGLVAPRLEYTLRTGADPAGGTNQPVLAQIQFGTNQDNTIAARRTDENSVYMVNLSDFDRLPTASWQLRQRRFWVFSEKEIVRAAVKRENKLREINHQGPYEWALAAGSQGIIDTVAVEETVRGLVQAVALAWVARGEQNPARFGITEQSLQVTLDLRDGSRATVQFGKEAPSGNPYAAVTLDGQLWIMEFPFPVFRDVLSYLAPK